MDYKVPYAEGQPGTVLDVCLRKSLAGLQYSKLNVVDILQLIQAAYYVNFSADGVQGAGAYSLPIIDNSELNLQQAMKLIELKGQQLADHSDVTVLDLAK